MKKRLQFCLMTMFVIFALSLNAQQEVFRVKFTVTDAYCYNNGKISYALTDAEGEVLDSLPEGLSMVRAYYFAEAPDTMHYSGSYYSGGYDTLTFNNGTYTIGVEGLLDNGTGGFIRVDTHTVISVNTTYQKPTGYTLGPFSMDGSYLQAGNGPSLSCYNTGRVQLKIENGRFPYRVTVLDHLTGDTLRTVTFTDRQYDGDYPSQYDYKDYYTIDSLGPGSWDFYVEDGCGYGLPRIETSVQVTKMPIPRYIYVNAASTDLRDSNLVRLQVNFDKKVLMFENFLDEHARYRFVYDGLGASEWQPMLRLYDNQTIEFSEVVPFVDRYCDLWDRDITFEYMSTCCDTITRQFTFQIHKPNDIYFEKDSLDVLDINQAAKVNPCIAHIPWHRDYYSIRYHSDDYIPSYDVTMETQHNDHEYYRYHYSHPLTWIYTDTRNGVVIKTDTVPDIASRSQLFYREIQGIYGNDSDTIVLPVERKLVDRRGCLLYSTFDTLSYLRCTDQFNFGWAITFEDQNDHCCNRLQEVRVFTLYRSFIDYDSVEVRLIESPYGGRYNFEAKYHAETESWEVRKESPDNMAEVIGAYKGNSITLRDYCMPSGPYTFEIRTKCDTMIVSQNIAFPDIYTHQLLERPVPTVEEYCSHTVVSYSPGWLDNALFNTSVETGQPLGTSYKRYPMKMRVVDAPSKEMINKELDATTRYSFSQSGRYVVRLYPNELVSLFCDNVYYFDTLDIGLGLVEFDYEKALVCDTSSTSGNVYVRGINGSKPYTYTLFSQPDKQGDTLGINSTGDFFDVPIRSGQTLSCLIQDSCSAYFPVNFEVKTLADLKKVWFDNGLTVKESCEGDTIQVHALTIGDILQYDWSGPNGFTATTSDPYIFIPRGNNDGWYKVDIRNGGCDEVISDSIFLTVQEAPRITLAPDTTVCPGEEFEVRFTPSSPTENDSLSFSIAYVNSERTDVRHYVAAKGETVTDRYQTKSPAKIYPVRLDDGRCDYLLADPDDTIYITLRTDITSACRLLTTHDTVCYGGEAHLTAKADVSTPYLVRWYADYEQTRLLKTDMMEDSLSYSYYDTSGIVDRTLLFTSLHEEGLCPSVNGFATDTLFMDEGTTELQCGSIYRFYDSGGGAPYSSFEHLVHRFQSSDSTRISITFKELRLNNSSHLMIFMGSEVNPDSILYDFTGSSQNPGTVVSDGNALTVFFQSALPVAAGWEAVVESAPGVAIADAKRKRVAAFRDEVCQSQTNLYDDPYGLVPAVASAEELNRAMRKSGSYYYHKTLPNSTFDGCDSVIYFELVVLPPVQRDTTAFVFASPEEGFLWQDSLYKQSGEYILWHSLPDGCDSLEVLRLAFLDVNIRDYEICEGDSAALTISVTQPEPNVTSVRKVRAGDVVCTDGAILHPDTFLASGKTAKGVVFYTDPSGIHGLMVALKESFQTMSGLSFNDSYSDIYDEESGAILDMNGQRNTSRLLNIAESNEVNNSVLKVPAVTFCHYYNHFTRTKDVVSHGWYLPSFGELNLLVSQCLEVNTTLRKLKNQDGLTDVIDYRPYWSSSIKQHNEVWVMYSNFEIYNERSSSTCRARPISTF